MRNLSFLMLSLAAALAFTGCSSNDDDEGEKTLLLGEFIDQWYLTLETKTAECRPDYSSIYLDYRKLSESAESKARLEASVAAGRSVYHADKAYECLQNLRATSCQDSMHGEGDEAEACDLMFEPNLAAGSDCYGSGECIDGYCDDYDLCPGKCVAYAKVNESCADTGCGENLYCDDNSKTCLAQKAAGAACAGGSECLDDHYCDYGSQTCLARKAVGAACTSSYECLHGECGVDGKCVEYEVEVGAGASCGGYQNGYAYCAEGLYCARASSSAEDGICVATKAAGAECESGSECGDKLACAGLSQNTTSYAVVKGKCTAWADIGADCTAVPEGSEGYSGCKRGLACLNGKCAAPPTSGACLVNEDFECDPRSTYCDATSQCVAKKANGAACVDSHECQSGDCDDGLCGVGDGC